MCYTRSVEIPIADELLFGWDPTPAIVSAWADRDGRALVWRRVGGRTVCERERFRPWLFAADLADLPTGAAILVDDPWQTSAPIAARELAGPDNHCRFLITARDGRQLERTLCAGASKRLGRAVQNLYELEDRYVRVGPVEQYLMASGRVYYRELAFDALHRMQIDLETTALDPQQGRIFMAALRDTRGFELVLEAPTLDDESQLIEEICAAVRARDPDVIENHNLFGFDLPFLESRAQMHRVELNLGRPEGPPGLQRPGRAAPPPLYLGGPRADRHA
jgi:DNA polymerase, archaea type